MIKALVYRERERGQDEDYLTVIEVLPLLLPAFFSFESLLWRAEGVGEAGK